MSAIRAIVRNGRIETEQPISLPDGTELTIQIPDSDEVEPEWDTSPDAIVAWIERDVAAIPPHFDHQRWEEAMSWLADRDRNSLEKLHQLADERSP